MAVPIDVSDVLRQTPLGGGPEGKVCVLGAGSSGLAVAKNLLELGIPFDCLEREDDVGGNWYYGKPHSSVYRSTRLISSKRETEYTDFPMPAEWPEHPRHELVWEYLKAYARRFGLYSRIEFNTAVERIEQASAGWSVKLTNGELRRYRAVVIANGHNWAPRWPEQPGTFDGRTLHSSQYKTPDVCRGGRVLVVGGGNSGFDIAVDVASSAAATFHSLRRAYPILPRYFRGVPIDHLGQRGRFWRAPLWLRRRYVEKGRVEAWGREVAESLPKADHRPFETHPVINSRWPYDVARGRIEVVPDVRELDGNYVSLIDGWRVAVDVIIYATGYKLSFPFIDRTHLNWRRDRPDLYLNIFHPERDDLFVAGLITPDSGQFGLVDHQARLIAAYLRGIAKRRPTALRFQAKKRRDAAAKLSGGIRYVSSPRHLIEVEHDSYRRRLQKAAARLR